MLFRSRPGTAPAARRPTATTTTTTQGLGAAARPSSSSSSSSPGPVGQAGLWSADAVVFGAAWIQGGQAERYHANRSKIRHLCYGQCVAFNKIIAPFRKKIKHLYKNYFLCLMCKPRSSAHIWFASGAVSSRISSPLAFSLGFSCAARPRPLREREGVPSSPHRAR